MNYRSLAKEQREYIILKAQEGMSVRKLAGQFNVSETTIRKVLAESAVSTSSANRKDINRKLIAMCNRLGITDAHELNNLFVKAHDTQSKLFTEPVKQTIGAKEVMDFMEALDFNAVKQIHLFTIALMTKEHEKIVRMNEQLKVKKETPNYGKQKFNQVYVPVSNDAVSG